MRFEIRSEPAQDMPPGARQWRWELVAAGQMLARSGTVYASEEECRRGIALVQGTDYKTPITVVVR